MGGRVSRHIRHNIWGIVAVFIALTGTAAALPGKNGVDSGDIKKGNVKLADIGANAVDSSKVVDNSLTGADIQESSLQGVQGPQGDAGERGPQGERGLAGPAGSDASINGVAAGGDLQGSYPDPAIRLNAIGTDETGVLGDDEIADSSIDGQDVANSSLEAGDIRDRTRSFSIGVSEVADPVFTRAGDTAPSRTTLGGYIPALGFGAAAENAFLLAFEIPVDYASGSGLEVTLRWSGSTAEAASNQIVWGGELDSFFVNTDVTPASPELTDTAAPASNATADQLRRTVLEFPAPGSQIVNDDLALLRISREAGNASDDYTGIANLHAVEVRYEATS